MSDSDDTDVLLLIPNDFFSVEDQATEKVDRRSSNLISFSSIKMDNCSEKDAHPHPCTAFEQYCADNFESSLRDKPEMRCSSEKNILQEIDSYLHQVNTQHPRLPHRTLHPYSSTEPTSENVSEIPSLRELWQIEGGHKSTGGGAPPGSLLEERLRRKHLERNLEETQIQLMEAQQKVSVALNVDQAKDVAIGKLRATVKDLQQRLEGNGEMLRQFDELRRDKETLEDHRRALEVELKTSLERSKKLKENNEILEEKVKHLTTATNDIREINKKQIEDLQTRLSNSLKAEQLINDDLVRTKNQLVIERNCHRENQEMWSRKETNFKSELDALRGSLKNYYQKQLNEVVGQKAKEFQKQLDDMEVSFKMDHLRRERQIAERAVEQMELIIRKNEEEVRLLSEKHREEIKFVQLQLEMAQATISEAQQRLTVQVREEEEGQENVNRGMREERQRILRQKLEVNERSPKKLNVNNNKTPPKKGFSAEKANSPELQNYIETVRRD